MNWTIKSWLSKYGEQLEHLGLTNIKHFESYCMVPNLPRLKSLDLNHVEINTVRFLISKVAKQNILKLTLKEISTFEVDDIVEYFMPNLNSINLD